MLRLFLIYIVFVLLKEVEPRSTTESQFEHTSLVNAVEICNISSNVTSKLEKVGDARYYFSGENERMNWHEARKWCSRHGLVLASVETEEKHKALSTHVKTRGWQDYWLGGTDEGSEGHWQWVSGDRFSFTAWRPGQPDNQWGLQNCLEMMHDDLFPGDNWWDRECLYIQHFICETSCE